MDRAKLCLNFDLKGFEKRKKTANEASIKEFDEEGFYLPSENVSIEELKIDDSGHFRIGIDVPTLGCLSIETELDDETMISLLTFAIKRANKYKSLVESLKSL